MPFDQWLMFLLAGSTVYGVVYFVFSKPPTKPEKQAEPEKPKRRRKKPMTVANDP